MFAELTEEESEAAALRIQAVHRGRMARKRVDGIRADRRPGTPPPHDMTISAGGEIMGFEDDEATNAAAVRIQAIQRGR